VPRQRYTAAAEKQRETEARHSGNEKNSRRGALRKEGASEFCLLSSAPHPTSLRSATFPSRGRLEKRTSQGLPLEGKLSAARLTDEVAGGLPCCFASHNDRVLLSKNSC